MNDTTNVLSQRRQQLAAIERLDRLPQTERWREIKNLLFKIHPEYVAMDNDFCEAVAEERNLNRLTATGATKSGAMRSLITMPDYLYTALKTVDPNFIDAQKADSKRLWRKLWQTFPEYRACEKI